MSDLTIAQRTDVAKFDPNGAGERDIVSEARIKLFARLRDRRGLEQEIDKRLDHQQDAYNWWVTNVRKGRPKKNYGSVILLTVEQAEEVLGVTAVQMTRWGKRLAKRDKYREAMVASVEKKLMAEEAVAHVTHNSGENEWYTPPEFIEAARRVMGGIDLDPSTSLVANRTVAAEMIYTAQENGLTQPWHGRVWMNPPYAQPLCAQFCDAAAQKLESGEIEQACVLVNNATETVWFQNVLGVASAVCFLKGRIKFVDPEGNPSGCPLQGQAIIYLGPNARAFYDEFQRMGTVLFHG